MSTMICQSRSPSNYLLPNRLMIDFLFGLIFILLVTVCVTSSRSGVRDVKFPEDIIVFPSDVKSDEKQHNVRNVNPRSFEHSEEFHKMYQSDRRPHDHRRQLGHSPEFHRNPNFHSFVTDVRENDNGNSNMVPLDLIQDINKFDNITDVFLNFVEGEERSDDADPVFLSDRFGSGERNAAVTPKSAGCMPELQTIKLAASEDASVLYIPQCTRIERCGGCCSHHLLSCQPTEVQPVSFSVMKTQYVGGKKLKFVGKEIIVVEKHTKCKCDCKVKAEDCNRFQQYKKPECRCACINMDEEKKCYRKNQTKLWDPELCSCICREVTPCSTGFEFDPIECRCAPSPTRSRYSEANPRSD